MKKRNAVLTTVLLGLLLTGCTGAAESGQESVLRQIGPNSANGFYFIRSEQSEEKKLFYADYQMQQMRPLCGQPGCTHKTDSCPAYLGKIDEEVLPIELDDQLLLIFTGQLGAEPARIEARQLDGSEPKTLVNFAKGSVMPNSRLFADEKYLYLTVSSDPKTQELMRVNLKNGKYRSVLKLDVNCDENIEWAVQGRLLMRQILRPTLGQYYWLDPENLEQEVVFSWDPNDVTVTFQDGMLCYWDKKNRDFGLRCLNLQTGENKKLTQYIVPKKGTVSVQDLDADHILIWQNGANGTMIETQTEATHEWALTQTDGKQPIKRCGETADGRYLVQISKKEPCWALIRAEDYWNGVPLYQYFESFN